MKKYLTFNSLLAVLGFITLMLFFVPCIGFKNMDSSITYDLNLFKASFGCGLVDSSVETTYRVLTCGGLVASFIFVIFAIVLNALSNRFKLFNFLAGGFYITSGTLTLCALNLVNGSNINVPGGIGTYGRFYNLSGIYAVGVLLIIWGAFSLIASVVSIAKPKQQEVY